MIKLVILNHGLAGRVFELDNGRATVGRAEDNPISIADPSIFKLCELVCGSLEKQLTRQAGSFAPGPKR